MKDYKLSEIKDICSKYKICDNCELYDEEYGFCKIYIFQVDSYDLPYEWEIDDETNTQAN